MMVVEVEHESPSFQTGLVLEMAIDDYDIMTQQHKVCYSRVTNKREGGRLLII